MTKIIPQALVGNTSDIGFLAAPKRYMRRPACKTVEVTQSMLYIRGGARQSETDSLFESVSKRDETRRKQEARETRTRHERDKVY